MIPLGAQVTAKLHDGSRVSGRVVMAWDGGLAIEPEHACQNWACPDRKKPYIVRDEDVVVRMATIP